MAGGLGVTRDGGAWEALPGSRGRRAAGLALMHVAAERPEPIPGYAKMSSVNPVILMPGVLGSSAERLAREFADSLTLAVGQMCTNPGIVLALDSPGLQTFLDTAGAALASITHHTRRGAHHGRSAQLRAGRRAHERPGRGVARARRAVGGDTLPRSRQRRTLGAIYPAGIALAT